LLKVVRVKYNAFNSNSQVFISRSQGEETSHLLNHLHHLTVLHVAVSLLTAVSLLVLALNVLGESHDLSHHPVAVLGVESEGSCGLLDQSFGHLTLDGRPDGDGFAHVAYGRSGVLGDRVSFLFDVHIDESDNKVENHLEHL